MNREGVLTEHFRQKCSDVSDSFLRDIQAISSHNGGRPSFDELMKVLQIIDKELTTEGVKILELYKNETGELPDSLTTDFKTIISDTVASFVKKL